MKSTIRPQAPFCRAGSKKISSALSQLPANTSICITFIQCRSNVEGVGPALYTCYAKVLCLLVWHCALNVGSMLGYCHRRWPNVKPAWNQCIVFSGIRSEYPTYQPNISWALGQCLWCLVGVGPAMFRSLWSSGQSAWHVACSVRASLQAPKTVTAHPNSEQLLPVGFARQRTCYMVHGWYLKKTWQKRWDVYARLIQCWASFADVRPTLSQHCLIAKIFRVFFIILTQFSLYVHL